MENEVLLDGTDYSNRLNSEMNPFLMTVMIAELVLHFCILGSDSGMFNLLADLLIKYKLCNKHTKFQSLGLYCTHTTCPEVVDINNNESNEVKAVRAAGATTSTITSMTANIVPPIKSTQNFARILNFHSALFSHHAIRLQVMSCDCNRSILAGCKFPS